MTTAKSGEAIQVSGLKRTVRELKKLDAETPKAVKALNREAATIVAVDAAARAPKRSGKLARSIRPGATQSAGTVRAGSKAIPYAAPIHFGWPSHNIAPQPFLYQALDHRRLEVVAAYEHGIHKLVAETVSGRGAD